MVFRGIMKFLVVDADKANVKYLQDVLRSLGCDVKACKYKEQALSLLRDKKQGIDIVVANVNIPYEMGFKFVEIVSKKMNIPIIMMCSASDNEVIAAGMNSGACHVAVKPLGINDVRQFWRCALVHRRQHLLGVGNSESNFEGLHGQENGSNQGTIERRLCKDRLIWTEDIKSLFVEAVHALGGKDLAVPKKIMKLMNLPNLTRDKIASHLQKYRLHSDPNYIGGKRKRKAAQAMQVNGIDEQSSVVAHPNRCVLSFKAPEFGNAQNNSTRHFGQIEGPSRRSRDMNSDSTQLNGMASYGNQQGAYFEEPDIAQFPVKSEHDTWQQLYSSSNVQPYVPEPSTESVMMQGMAVPDILTIPDPELESFLAMDLTDPNFPFFDEYPPQDMSMFYGGLSNGLHDNKYPVGQSEMGNDDLCALNDRITIDPATDSLIKSNVEATNPMAMHYPQNISAMGGNVDRSNTSGQQQQEQIGGTPLEQPWSWSDLGTIEPSTSGHGTGNGYVWFGSKPPGST